MVAIICGEPKRFRPLDQLYCEASRRAGYPAEKLVVGLHSIGFLADTTQQAADDFDPGQAKTFKEIGKERGRPHYASTLGWPSADLRARCRSGTLKPSGRKFPI